MPYASYAIDAALRDGGHAESRLMINDASDLDRTRKERSAADDSNVDETVLQARRIAFLTPATMAVAVMVAVGFILLIQLGGAADKQIASAAKFKTPNQVAKIAPGGSPN
jgi:hypothetical protein